VRVPIKLDPRRRPIPGASIVKVKATVIFEAYVVDPGYLQDKSIEERIADEIADAVGYRAPRATDAEEGDALIAMTSDPSFAVDVRDVEVLPVKARIDPEHVIEMAQGTDAMI
jgi:hypothetical protein